MDNEATVSTQQGGWLDGVRWNADGLVPVIAQELETGDVLMFAWMNREALSTTVATGQAVYFSRSRQMLWFKGESSGHSQIVHDIRLDCDGDVLLMRVTQIGHTPSVACHTGRHSCFYKRLENGCWIEAETPLVDPHQLYSKP